MEEMKVQNRHEKLSTEVKIRVYKRGNDNRREECSREGPYALLVYVHVRVLSIFDMRVRRSHHNN